MTRPDNTAKLVSKLPADAVVSLLTATADWVLVIDKSGVVQSVEHNAKPDLIGDIDKWAGQSWFDTVTSESRPKLESLLKDANTKRPGRWRQVNHPVDDGPDVPVRYTSIALKAGKVLAVGQDLSDVAELQQRIISAQQSIEGDFARRTQTETRYQLLFDMSAEAFLIIDAASGKIREANPAAGRLLGKHIAPLIGSHFPHGFDAESTHTIENVLRRAQNAGRADDAAVRTADGNSTFLVSASMLRDRRDSTFFVRLAPMGDSAETFDHLQNALISPMMANLPDGFVVCDVDGKIVAANEAFATMTQCPSVEHVVGETLERWLGRTGIDQRILIANIKEHGSVPRFATVVVGDQGASTQVEIAAAAVDDIRFPFMIFVLRSIEGRMSVANAAQRVPQRAAPLAELVGRVPLKELVRESTDLVERLCIEAALELTSDNRASAAEMLGVSRQSLYVKLRRFGLADSSAVSDD